MRSRLLFVLPLIVALLLVPGVAGAGGGADVDWDPAGGPQSIYRVPGSDAGATATVHQWDTGWIGDGPWFVYLLEWRAGSDASYPPPDAMLLGRASVARSARVNEAIVTFSFVVPHVPSGEYAVTVCDWGCRTQFGDFFGEWFRIVESPLEARLLQRMDRIQRPLYARIDGLERDLNHRIDAVDLNAAGSSTVSAWGERIGKLESRIEVLQARVASAGRSAPWWFGIGAGSTLLALGAWRLLVGRRRRRELRELLTEAVAPAEIVPFELEPVD